MGRRATVLFLRLNIVDSLDTAVEIDISEDWRRSSGKVPLACVRESDLSHDASLAAAKPLR